MGSRLAQVPVAIERLSREDQRVPGAEAVSNRIDAPTIGDSIRELVLCGLDHLVQYGKHFLGCVSCQPHVNQEGLGGVGYSEFDALEE